MPEEDQDNIEEEMMQMMQQELGGEAGAGEDADADLEAEMLHAMQEEAAGQEDGSGAGEDPLESQMLQAMMAETGATTEVAAREALQKTRSILPGQELSSKNIPRLLDIKLAVSIELGRTEENIDTLLGWTEGSLIELDKVSGEPVDVLINGKHFARGEVVVVAENFGVRLTEIDPTVPGG